MSPVHATEVTKSSPKLRMCAGDCGEPLSAKRLQANPAATLCVTCLEKQGDVPTIKRYDEVTPSGETISTTFTANKRIERQMRRTNSIIASEEDFAVALGDDSHLVREPACDNDEHAYHMSEAFEVEDLPETVSPLAFAVAASA